MSGSRTAIAGRPRPRCPRSARTRAPAGGSSSTPWSPHLRAGTTPATSERRPSSSATARPSTPQRCALSRSSWTSGAWRSAGGRAMFCSWTTPSPCTHGRPSCRRAAYWPRSAARPWRTPRGGPPAVRRRAPTPWPRPCASASSARAPWARSTSATSRYSASRPSSRRWPTRMRTRGRRPSKSSVRRACSAHSSNVTRTS
mmetsp:Transcript_505/g.1354  ORF Transcript_505/g.1354 Transcript_505/m.1354 type:complete len:200 (+) Transcript_505:367-966(+)